MKLKYIAIFMIAACGLALAATYGPFYVSALGPDYMNTTLQSDAQAEYEAANKLAQIYLSPIINTPAKIAKALRSDYIRVVYYGGAEIADFKIKRWPSAIPVDFSEQVAATDTKRLSASYQSDVPTNCTPGPQGIYSVTYNTGYWGSYSYVDSSNVVNVIGNWVDTGPQTVSYRGGTYNAARMCP